MYLTKYTLSHSGNRPWTRRRGINGPQEMEAVSGSAGPIAFERKRLHTTNASHIKQHCSWPSRFRLVQPYCQCFYIKIKCFKSQISTNSNWQARTATPTAWRLRQTPIQTTTTIIITTTIRTTTTASSRRTTRTRPLRGWPKQRPSCRSGARTRRPKRMTWLRRQSITFPMSSSLN